jgi:hypothetical protein
MGGSSAGAAVSVVLEPSAEMTVAVRSLSQGLSARPGRHNQTVFDGAAEGDATAEGSAVSDGESVSDESPQETASRAIRLRATVARILRMTRDVIVARSSSGSHRRVSPVPPGDLSDSLSSRL